MYDSQSIPLLSTGIGTPVSEPHPCRHSISLLLLLLASHSQLSATAKTAPEFIKETGYRSLLPAAVGLPVCLFRHTLLADA